jgi:starch phosphorylase
MLYNLIEQEIIPEFYDAGGAWTARMRASLKTLSPEFSATRMLADYGRKMYWPTS